MQAISGTIGLISGLVGMQGGLRASNAGPGIGPLFSILSGQEQQAAARQEAAALGRESDFAMQAALTQAAIKEQEGKAFKEQQALDFASSGVTLQGSPLAVLTGTQQKVDMEKEAILARGREEAGLFSMQGLQMLRRGTAASFGGFANALQSQFVADQQKQQLRRQAWQTGLTGISALASGGGAAGGSGFFNGIGNFFGGSDYNIPSGAIGIP